MNDWLMWGLPVIQFLQSLGDWLVKPMEFFSFLGREEFFLLVLPLLLWCVDVGLGVRAGVILLASAGLNSALKFAFGWPRPYWVSTEVKAWSGEGSFGAPSGHAQNAAALWGRLAVGWRRAWVRTTLILLVLLISLSRIALAVHFPTDVVIGWLAGLAVLWAFVRLEARLRQWLVSRGIGAKVLGAFLVSALVLGIGLIAWKASERRPAPESWAAMASAARPQDDPIDPRSIAGLVGAAGTLFGLVGGAALLEQWNGFNPGGPFWKRAVRYVVGAVGMGVLFFGLRAVLPTADTALGQALRYLRYAAAGFWVSYGAPRLFVALRLA